MIEIRNISKTYNTGGFEQKALDGVSICFRDSEFAAVLGTSGSGKTTLLNVIGGLDHADSGDIVIDGVSTADYKASDWNTYRNHHVGFIFQSYNLIPHQTVLSNVELALTLAGVGRAERKRRALIALEKVGLAEHASKKPAQLSGGQAQRVAIARAIVNDPDIVLADEPTGALDTETGIQVMDLLAEIARDRLVIMVTHNPDLADEYANRIVRLKDGHIIADDNPYVPTLEENVVSTDTRKKAKMSFATALGLSFSNLMSKKGRTFMTAFAGSIGIMGIAAILALSNGVNDYIADTEAEALTSYPITITKSSFDLGSLLETTMGYGQTDTGSAEGHTGSDLIPETRIMTDMFAQVKNNDLKTFKEYLEEDTCPINDYAASVRYRYDITPLIYAADTSHGAQQLNPSKAGSSLSNSLMSSAFSLSGGMSDSFSEMNGNQELLEQQMMIVDGRWPESYDECALVLNQAGEISDYTLYSIGIFDVSALEDMFKKMISGETVDIPEVDSPLTYDDALNMTFKVVPKCSLYKKNEETGMWSDVSGDPERLARRIASGIDLKVVGIIKPNPDYSGNPMSEGIAYTPALTYKLMDIAADSDIVKEQKKHTHHDVFTGKTFDELKDEQGKKLDFEDMFTIDKDAIESAFSFDTSSLSGFGSDLDLSGLSLDASAFDMSDFSIDQSALSQVFDEQSLRTIMANAPAFDASYISFSSSDLTPEQQAAVNEAAAEMSAGFSAWIIANNKSAPTNATEYSDLFQEYLNDPTSGAAEITTKLESSLGESAATIVQNALSTYFENVFAPYLSQALSQIMEQAATVMATQMAQSMADQMAAATSTLGSTLSSAISGQLSEQMSQLSSAMENGFTFDADVFASAIHLNMTQEDLTNLLSSYLDADEISYEANLKKLGYAEAADPMSISIYPIDFAAKNEIASIIEDYNAAQEEAGNDDGTIQYSDIAGVLMSSVTDIVNTISLVLIAFVSISLVVSSIMIGIITYISVLERKKEIGILRAMGASAGNIANVFNAETFIEGLISGLLAVGIVMAASVPVNAVVYEGFDVPHVMSLPISSAAVLVLVSVGLTFIAGLVPSQSASRKDPVEALRSE